MKGTNKKEQLKLVKQICKRNNDYNYLLLQDIIKMSIRDLYTNCIDKHDRRFFTRRT